MSTQFLKRILVVLSIILAQLAFLLAPGAVTAATTAKALPTKAIVTAASTYLNQIRQYFFCQTAKCKKEVAANKVLEKGAVAGLNSDLKLMKDDSVPSSMTRITRKYEADAVALLSAVDRYPKQKSAFDEAQNAGIIYYQSANVGSDAYVLDTILLKATVNFKQWSVGVVGVVYAMQVDTQAESAKASTATVISANRSLLLEAQSLRSDANGPNATFNTMLVKFANTQIKESNLSILVLTGKKTSTTRARLAALATSLSAQFTKIVNMQNKLAK